MRVVILQPSYLPWLGYFDQIAKADFFVFYDDVQFDKNGWRNRNKIKTPQGGLWLTVPVRLKNHLELPINNVEIDNLQNWKNKHFNSLEINYSKAPFFLNYCKFFKETYSRHWDYISELDIYLTVEISRILGIKTQFFRSSELGIKGDKTSRLINICKHFAADRYLTGDSAKDYLDQDMFRANSIDLEYQDYHHPEYPQLYGDFIQHMSIVDLLFNCGRESLPILSDKRSSAR
jgi:hypothetical protein